MVAAILNGLIRLVFYILSAITDIIIYPIQVVLVSLVPTAQDYLLDVVNFFSLKVFPAVQFFVQVFQNLTGIPHSVYLLIILHITTVLSVATALRLYMFMYRMYRVLKGTQES